MRQHEIRMTIMSHLSDAQHLISLGLKEEANDRINFAKLLLLEYPNVEVFASEDKLNELWNKLTK